MQTDAVRIDRRKNKKLAATEQNKQETVDFIEEEKKH